MRYGYLLKPSILAFWILLSLSNTLRAQNVCSGSGNLMIFTNYDGGTLNINVDQNIPNLKIGIVSYEAIVVNLSGAFLNNVTGVRYAGYNGNNNPCGVVNTTINGAPSSAVTSTVFAPPVTISNPNGYSSIICGYSCSNNSNQGGCNTVDQIEAYFLNYFSGSTLFAHRVQYGCWSGTYSVSAGGNCCPANPFVAGSIAASQSVCPNATVAPLTSVNPASGGTGPISYQWESSTVSQLSGFTPISSANGASYSPPPVNLTTYFRRGASTSANPTIYSNVLTVTVLPVSSVGISAQSPACTGQTINLNVLAQTAVSYTWSGPAAFSSTLQSVSIPAQLANSGVYSVAVTYGNGCVNSASTQITVVPSPTITASGTTVCVNAPTTMTASGATLMNWVGPNGLGAGGPTLTIPTTGTVNAGIYTITAINAPCFATATVELVVNPLPALMTASTAIACSGQAAVLSASGAISYTWTGPMGYTATTSAATLAIVSNTSSGIYTITGTGANACVASASVLLNVQPSPTVSITNPPPIVICLGTSIKLNANGAQVYQWSGASPVDNSSALASPLVNTIVALTGTANGCASANTATIAVKVDACTGIRTLQGNAQEPLIYPNPNAGGFTVSAKETMQLQLTNELGQLVKTLELKEDNGYRVSLSGLAEGVYHLSSAAGSFRQKIVVVK